KDKPRWSYRKEIERFAEIGEIGKLMSMMGTAARAFPPDGVPGSDADARLAACLQTGFEMGRRAGYYWMWLELEQVARGHALGLVREDALLRYAFDEGSNIIRYYSGQLRPHVKPMAEHCPSLVDVAKRAAARVLEIELRRGDTPTAVSPFVSEISRHEGAGNFVRILAALDKETFVRGYIWSSNHAKKEMLSSLLKASVPSADDDVDTLRAALGELGGKIPEKRLIEAAMYAPAWTRIVGRYLGWKGFETATWYFHAHMSQTFSAEKETEVARYSPIEPKRFNEGAFDVDWFGEAYRTLGDERFGILYDCAKYICDGAGHRRAQMFADAALGRLDKGELERDAHGKRNKDKLLSYSILPLDKKKRDKDLLERYESIRLFLKESKQFGAQRRASEAVVAEIALENLARNAGFQDVLRFSWRMETQKIKEIKGYFEPKSLGDYSVHVQTKEDGSSSLVVEKGEKRLKSVPAELKKHAYVLECKEIVAGLKEQLRRARTSLENAMVSSDRFSYGELKGLIAHPVISPLLQKLLFVVEGEGGEGGKGGEGVPPRVGAFCELSDIADDADCRVAHPVDLYRSGRWHEIQRETVAHRLVQPFKQVFRELYLPNEDELREKVLSRRYAGHQVQPTKTVALLRGRGWTVDYDEGLQRVCYGANLIATMYAAADWFSPADIEAPTLEYVKFLDRKDWKPVELASVPPIVFSEVMRDVDLVVSVAHVGGVDPEASLSTVEMRGAIVRELLALLKIENAKVEGRFVKIEGTLGAYSLHLGSGNVQMAGRGELNILAVPSQHRGRVFLPFADDDPRTAEILSKALLLADDAKIKDPAILAQIRGSDFA
ncbi:MAG: DUF4132 domain-containing protein, partial [Clostridiales Family XIII bacterium]|nr:DUF4132 domain-containing protein [Clostridiales Family XIII bacterium]